MIDIPILFEDDDVVAVNKPAGLIVHPDGHDTGPSLAGWMAEKYPESKIVGEPIRLQGGEVIDRPGIVHRLDRDTTGVIILAKNQRMFEYLKHQFQDHTIRKTYEAFVYGEMKKDHGTIDRPIGRSRSDFRLWSAQRGARGEMRPAVTRYEVLKRGGGFSFVEIEPKTGRTHQIRVHFKAINYPLVSDNLYAPNHPQALGFNRVALHARRIAFDNMFRERVVVEAPYPEDFKVALKKFEEFNKPEEYDK